MPRADLGRIFDETKPDRSLPFKVVVLMAGGDPVFSAIADARDNGWFKELVGAIHLNNGIADFDDADPGDADLTIQLQGIVDPRLGMFDMGRMTAGGVNARKRVCRVSVALDPPVNGTGFLIGPQAVLTARHVVERVIEEEAETQATRHELISVHFDEVGPNFRTRRCGVMPQWLIAGSPRHDLEAPNSRASALDEASADEFRDRLDYAVLRLDRPVGRERGYYKLSETRQPSVGATQSAIGLYQHPAGGSMHSAFGVGETLWPKEVHTRLRHTAASIGGSSGGLIVDKAFEVVAMHQCSFVDEHDKPVMNGAIPTACIAARRDRVEDIVGAPDYLWRIATTGEPVVGRDLFQQGVDAALTGDVRIICVRGGVDADQSFTTTLLRGMLDEASHLVAVLSGASLPLDAIKLAEAIAMRLPVGAIGSLPRPEDADTALDAWMRDHLVPALLTAFRTAAGNRMLWLVLDDLDAHPVGEGTAARLLERLYAEAGVADFLRIVLIGQRTPPPGARPDTIFYDDVGAIEVPQIADHLARRYTEAGDSRTMEAIQGEALLILNAARVKKLPFARAVSVALTEMLPASGKGPPT